MSDPTQFGKDTPGSASTDYNMLAFVFKQMLARLAGPTFVQVIDCTNDGGISPVGTVTVQPLINQVSGGPQAPTPHGKLFKVPYLRIQGGANAVIIDPVKGDIGLACFASRDTSRLKAAPQDAVANGGVNPGSFAMYDWADGLYLGGFLNGVPTQYIAFAPGGIEIVSPEQISLTAGGKVVTLNSTGLTIDGILFETHSHLPGTYNISGTPVTGEAGNPKNP